MTSTVGRLLVAAAGVAETRFLLRTIGFRRTIALMKATPRLLPASDDVDPRTVPEIDWAANRVGGSCLDRSVLLWFLLHQRGIAPSLRIGIARDGDTIDGHAWVELDGSVINDAPDVAVRFAPFAEDPTELTFT